MCILPMRTLGRVHTPVCKVPPLPEDKVLQQRVSEERVGLPPPLVCGRYLGCADHTYSLIVVFLSCKSSIIIVVIIVIIIITASGIVHHLLAAYRMALGNCFRFFNVFFCQNLLSSFYYIFSVQRCKLINERHDYWIPHKQGLQN